MGRKFYRVKKIGSEILKGKKKLGRKFFRVTKNLGQKFCRVKKMGRKFYRVKKIWVGNLVWPNSILV